MKLNIERTRAVRGALFFSLIIIIIAPLALYNFQMSVLFSYLKMNLECLFIWLTLVGGLIIAIFCKEKRKQMGLEQEANVSENLKKQVIMPDTHSSASDEDLKTLANENKVKQIDTLIDLMSKGKEDVVISKIYEELNKGLSGRKECIYRFILYKALMSVNNDNYLDDIIENNKKLVELVKKYEKKGVYKHTEIQLNLAIAYAKKKQFDDMLKENFKVIKEVQKAPKLSNEIKGLSYHIQAVYYLNKNNIPYAMGYFEKAAQCDENNCEILFNMALVYYYTERNINKCLECISKIDRTAISDTEQFRFMIVMQYYCLALEKRYSEAYEIINSYCLSEHNIPENMKAHKAYIAYKMNFYEEAKKITDEILSKEYDATAMNVRAMLQIENGLYKEALANLNKIIPDFSENEEKYYLGEIYYHRSYANLKLNNVQEAIDDYNHSSELKFIDYAPDYIVELDIAQAKLLEDTKYD